MNNENIELPEHPKKAVDGEVDENLAFKLEMSSIIISTNLFGDFSKCTVISELINEKNMKIIVEDARKLWQKFVHQPQTARCLVFFLVLGEICNVITRDYEEAYNKLTSHLKLDVG